LTVLGDLVEPKNLCPQSLNTNGKKGRVRVQRRNFRGKGEEKKGMGGAGGLEGVEKRQDM
jgi:hypothetical protein